MRVHDSVVVHHRHHEPTRERVAVEQSDRGHRVCEQPVPQAVESFREEARRGCGVLEIEAIGVELREAGCCDYDAGGELGL